ncbi:efflux RND transporter periplasmic adaptor subunit [Shewanella sp. KX20019]|uniref:efflux RND transporter periplasmic adaptor subunit n=1 Tax=Shewanella sp. KX20019 TaxID=2803864 RepID=UPI0019287A50|nr:efflux RND transporter periplasmic adaptor subunit [Shewanella sp. KX20019]QQX79281.1 efflux RND transporter periplasmic adaptor subunit [Shewanella sp. KX20019]
MNKFIIAATALIFSAFWYFTPAESNQVEFQYQTQVLATGDIQKTVGATGALAAVDDLVVGSQLSGQITELLVDFNDKVEKGQLLARIDPRTFSAKVEQYQAQIANIDASMKLQQVVISKAKLSASLALRDLVRGQGLVASNNISAEELDQLKTAAAISDLDVLKAKAELDALTASKASTLAQLLQAQIELDRTEIRAPISGIVINRTIEAGQTVASSYNTPELFVIAKDLSQMEIEAYVDESDIGFITSGQRVDFAVDAYPLAKFFGKVRQIRQYPETDSGVVTYTVIISAPNPRGQLLPGMTADLTVRIDTARNVVRVPNSAIRIAARQASLKSSNERSGKQSMGKMSELMDQLELTDLQRQQVAAARPDKGADPMARNREQARQRLDRALKQILTSEQQQLLKALRSGQVKSGYVMILEESEPKLMQVQLGLSDDQFTQIEGTALVGKAVVTQIQQVKL